MAALRRCATNRAKKRALKARGDSELGIGDLERGAQTLDLGFDRAWRPEFFHTVRPGEIYRGAEARWRHYAWADIPAELVTRWTEEREQAAADCEAALRSSARILGDEHPVTRELRDTYATIALLSAEQ